MKKGKKSQASPIIVAVQYVLLSALAVLTVIRLLQLIKVIEVSHSITSLLWNIMLILNIVSSILTVVIRKQRQEGYHRSRKVSAKTQKHIAEVCSTQGESLARLISKWDDGLLAVLSDDAEAHGSFKYLPALTHPEGYKSYWTALPESGTESDIDGITSILSQNGVCSVERDRADGTPDHYYRIRFRMEKYAPLYELWYVPKDIAPEKLEPQIIKSAERLSEKYYLVNLKWVYIP